MDDGGQHPLPTLIDALPHQGRIHYLYQQNQGPGKARNLGAEKAKGRYIAFTDDDCAPDSEWLAAHLRQLSTGLMVGGHTHNTYLDNVYSETSQLLITFLYQYFQGTPQYFFTSNNMSVCKETFTKLGGFDADHFRTSAGEDRELSVRWSHHGYILKHDSQATVQHFHWLTLKTYWGMHLKYGKAAVPFHQKVKSELQADADDRQPYQWLGHGRFVIALLRFPFAQNQYSSLQKWKIAALLFLSQIAGAAGYFLARIGK